MNVSSGNFLNVYMGIAIWPSMGLSTVHSVNTEPSQVTSGRWTSVHRRSDTGTHLIDGSRSVRSHRIDALSSLQANQLKSPIKPIDDDTQQIRPPFRWKLFIRRNQMPRCATCFPLDAVRHTLEHCEALIFPTCRHTVSDTEALFPPA